MHVSELPQSLVSKFVSREIQQSHKSHLTLKTSFSALDTQTVSSRGHCRFRDVSKAKSNVTFQLFSDIPLPFCFSPNCKSFIIDSWNVLDLSVRANSRCKKQFPQRRSKLVLQYCDFRIILHFCDLNSFL